MKIFVISDTHFNHAKLVEYGRPKNFSALIVENLQKVKGDLLLHLGDFCIGNDDMAMAMFNMATLGFGKKILVKGNHDHKPDGWYMDRGFDFVCESFTAKYFGKRLLFSHVPSRPRPDVFNFNIHGHLHGNMHRLIGELAEYYDPAYHKDVAPDIWNYKPVDLERLVQ